MKKVILSLIIGCSLNVSAGSIVCVQEDSKEQPGYKLTFSSNSEREVTVAVEIAGHKRTMACSAPKACVETKEQTCGSAGLNDQTVYVCGVNGDRPVPGALMVGLSVVGSDLEGYVGHGLLDYLPCTTEK